MNRELKFRLWDKENKSWHNPNILEVWDESGNMTPFQYVKTGKLDPIYMTLDNWIIQQYTGLKDKNGKEIYEGDIVIFPKRTYAKYATVVYSEYDAAFKIEDRFVRELLKFNDVIVVGNIFENKDLLQ